MPLKAVPQSMKMSDSPLLNGAKALRPLRVVLLDLAALAHGTTP